MNSPKVSFVIGGAQKCGTTALASFLGGNAGVRLPDGKEAHVFDLPDFNEDWSAEQVDNLYKGHFGGSFDGGQIFGDATPIYFFHPALVSRIARYNPKMKWVVLLRHPVERAVSQYHMERRRGHERLPFWLAVVAERFRLKGRWGDLSHGSPIRVHSYLARGDYACQLDVLYAHFPAEQVLLLRNDELSQSPDDVMRRVCRFLGVEPETERLEYSRVFSGGYSPLAKGSFSFRLATLLLWRQMRRAKNEYGLKWK